jgi:hypothetical protein
MSSIHTVGEYLRNKNRKKKSRSLEEQGKYSLSREDGTFRVTQGARVVGFRSTQQDAHKLIKTDTALQASIAAKVQEKAA